MGKLKNLELSGLDFEAEIELLDHHKTREFEP
jgi:hypothetical protein